MQVTDENKMVFVTSFLDSGTQAIVSDAIAATQVATHEEKMAIAMGFLSSQARGAVRHSSYIRA